MPLFTDQTRRKVLINDTPQRIVSLVPSQTELLYDLGLDEEVLGITKFCVHPDYWFRTKTRVGGTKRVNIEFLKSLEPDLIIANKEENVKEQVEELAKHYPVWTSDVHDLDMAYEMIEQIGIITGKHSRAIEIVEKIKRKFELNESRIPKPVSRIPHPESRIPACYLIWKDPYLSVGGDTFIHCMMEKAGFRNVFIDKTRYPIIEIGHLEETDCEVVLLSSEPFPFKEKHVAILEELLPGMKFLLVDGEMFSWYGSRLFHAASYFRKLQEKMKARYDSL